MWALNPKGFHFAVPFTTHTVQTSAVKVSYAIIPHAHAQLPPQLANASVSLSNAYPVPNRRTQSGIIAAN